MTKEEQQLILEAQRAYKKIWRAKNKDRVKASNQRYWLKRALKEQREQKKGE